MPLLAVSSEATQASFRCCAEAPQASFRARITTSPVCQEKNVHKNCVSLTRALARVSGRCKAFKPTMAPVEPSTHIPPRAHVSRTSGRGGVIAAWLAWLRPWAARAADLCPLTLRGALVLGAAAFALYWYGFGELDGVWYVVGLSLTGLCALALLLVLAAAVRMKLWLRRGRASDASPVAVDTGYPLQLPFAIPRLRFWLLLEVRVSWLAPSAARVTLTESGPLAHELVRLDDHGEVRTVTRRIEVRDVFGLASLAIRKQLACAIDVLPHRGALLSLSPLESLAGGDDFPHPMGVAQGDRLELKRYAPGDPARFIHWKVYARTQKLVVRMPERALSRAYRVAAFLVAAEGDGASAAVARVALEQGALGGDFRFGADGSPTPTERVDQALVALRRSAGQRADSGRDLALFVREVEREGPAALVIFVAPGATVAQTRIAALLRERQRPLRVVLGVDGIVSGAPPSLLSRLALQRAPSTRTALRALQESVAFYKRLGCEVVVVDRNSGRLLGDAHLAHAARVQTRQEVAA